MTLETALQRADELEAAVWRALPEPYLPAINDPRHKAALIAAIMAIEHARSARVLMGRGLQTSAIGVGRMQFEALCRSMWLLYAAEDADVVTVSAELTEANAKEANDIPSAAKMVDALQGKAPAGAVQMLKNFKQANLKALHQFVHAGFQPLRRLSEGYPAVLVVNVLRNCNGLLVMTGAMLAILAGSQHAMGAMSRLQVEFADCLPDIHPAPGRQ